MATHPISIDSAGGEYMEAVLVIAWAAKPGDPVKAGDLVVTVETAKAATEIEASSDGWLAEVFFAEGQEAPVGAVLGTIADERPMTGGEPAPAATAMQVSAPQKDPADQASASARTPGERPIASPLARRMAAAAGLDLSTLTGSGPNGRIKKRDVDAALAARGTALPQGRREETPPAFLPSPLPVRQAAPVVLIHGFGADRSIWRQVIPLLGPAVEAIGLDLPGHGRSPRVVPHDLDAICEMVEARLAAEGVEAATLMGHSFGAAVAARLASRGYVSARSLLLMSPGGLGPEIRAAFVEGFVLARQASSLLPWLHELVFDASGISPAFLRVVEEQRRDEGLTRSLHEFALRYFADGTQTFSIRQDLERLRMPTRVIFGVQDRIIPFAHSNLLPARIGLHAFRQCGHLPYMEQAELSLAILNEMVALGQSDR